MQRATSRMLCSEERAVSWVISESAASSAEMTNSSEL